MNGLVETAGEALEPIEPRDEGYIICHVKNFGTWGRGTWDVGRTDVLSIFLRSWIVYLKDHSPYLR